VAGHSPEGAVLYPDAPVVGRRRQWSVDLGVLVAFIVLGVVMYRQAWMTNPAEFMQAGGDQWRNVWFFEWAAQAIQHGHNPFYSSAANYPYGVNVLINAGAPLLGLVLSPITWAFGPIAAYNLCCTLALSLSAFSAYWVIRHIAPWWGARAGGRLERVSPEQVAHVGQVNLSFSALVPLMLFSLYRILTARGRRLRWGVALGVISAGQFLISSEVLFETALVAAVGTGVAAVMWRRELSSTVRPVGEALLSAGAVALVLLAYPVWVMTKGPGHIVGRVQLVAAAYRADLLASVVPNSSQLLRFSAWTHAADVFNNGIGSNGSYLGIPLLVLLVCGLVWRRRHPLVVVAAATGSVAWVCSLGAALTVKGRPGLTPSGDARGVMPLPMAVFAHAPLLDNTIPARFALLVFLMAAVVGAVMLGDLFASRRSRRHGCVMCSAAAVVALVPLLPARTVPAIVRTSTPGCFARLPSGRAVVVFPFPSATFPQPMLWQAQSHIRFGIPGGSYFVPQPPAGHVASSGDTGYTLETTTSRTFAKVAAGHPPPETTDLRNAALDEWGSWRITAVVAVPGYARDPVQSIAFLDWLVGTEPTDVSGCLIWPVS
jgi:hypothetical protein